MPSDSDSLAVSFVVIAYNEAAGIERAIRSILAQDDLPSHEVIVVDDGSTDRTAHRVAAVAGEAAPVRLVRLGRNHGRGFARDAGVRLARGAVIAMIDADVILPRHWTSTCLAALRNADAVGGTAVPDGDVAYLCKRFGLRPRVVPHTTTVSGSNAAFRRELFDRISFDPSLREGEDVAINHALRGLARTHSIPGLTVEHHGTKDLGATLMWLFQSGRGASRQLRRYREVRQADVVFCGWLLCAAPALRAASRGRLRGLSVPLVYAVAAATAHVSRGFVAERRTIHRLLAAVLLDAGLITAYFAGRLAGISDARPTAEQSRR